MRYDAVIILNLWICLVTYAAAQKTDTFYLTSAVSKNKTIAYKRVIEYKTLTKSYHVQDYFDNGQLQMDACYSAFDKQIKEEYQCHYRGNDREGKYTEWHSNGQKRYEGNFKDGRRHGLQRSWYSNGVQESEEHWLNGQLHGHAKYWNRNGQLEENLWFEHGMNKHPRKVSYKYLASTPKGYAEDTLKYWPLIIYLHGGSDRGTDLNKLYSKGIPDQIFRGRAFPFIIISPQCPEHLRFSTDDWFEDFYCDILSKYRIDTNRIYITGASLGGAGTWYLAARYPGIFSAIAPLSGFTSHLNFIDQHIDRLENIPIWAFHGKNDLVVPFEETDRMIKKLEGKNKHLTFTAEPNVGHEIDWLVYPNQALYDWFLTHDKSKMDKD